MNGPGTSLRTRVVTTREELAALEAGWEGLLASLSAPTPFMTHEWALSWWETLGEGQALRVLALEDDVGLAGLAPFAIARRRLGPVAFRSLEILGTGRLPFLGMGLADRADLLLARRAAEGRAAVLEWLASTRAEWDLANWRFVPEDSATLVGLDAAAHGLGLRAFAEPCSLSPYLALTGTYADYVASRGKKFRQRIRRGSACLERHGRVELDLALARRDPLGALAEAVRLAEASWKGRRGTALLLHRPAREFFRALLPRMAAKERLALALLRAGGKPVAHELCYRLDGKLWAHDACFDPAFAQGAPGVVLMARLLEGAWQEGLREYDFLRGDEGYKATWGTRERAEREVLVAHGAARSRIAAAAFRARWRLKRSRALVRLQSRAAGLATLLARRGATLLARRGGTPE